MLEVTARRIAKELNDLMNINHKKYQFVAFHTFDTEWDATKEMYNSWIVKLLE